MTRPQTANLTSDVGAVMAPAARGLSSSEAQRRLAQTGPNELRREQATSRVVLLSRQFASPVIWLLAGAAVASSAFGERGGVAGNASPARLRAASGRRRCLHRIEYGRNCWCSSERAETPHPRPSASTSPTNKGESGQNALWCAFGMQLVL